MSLPSQTSRGSGNARSYMSRNKGLNLRPIAVGTAVVAVVAAAVWGISKLGKHSDAGLGPQTATAAPAKPAGSPNRFDGSQPSNATRCGLGTKPLMISSITNSGGSLEIQCSALAAG